MARWTTIALTFPGLDQPERNEIYDFLETRNWIKSAVEDTLWKKVFEDENKSVIVGSLESDLVAAASGTSLTYFTASYQVANSEPFTRMYTFRDKWHYRQIW